MQNSFHKKDIFLSNINIDNFNVLSLDIFDTLLFRTVENPKDVFIKVGEEAIMKGVLREGITPFEFKELRILAEREARKRKKDESKINEVTIKEIYQCFPKNIGKIDILQNIEIEKEKECCYINPNIESLIKLFKSKNKKVFLLSDMYLSRENIKEILSYNNFYINLVDDIFVSSEYKCSKANGLLFKKLIDALPNNLKPNRIIHIGDNKNSDFYNAKEYGLEAIYYNVVPKYINTVYHYEKIRYGGLLKELRSLRKLADCMHGHIPNEYKFWYEIGASVFGPFYTLFAKWVADIVEKEKKIGIYGFMRDTKVLCELVEKELENRNIKNIDIKPIYISRQSVYLASIKSFNRENIEYLMSIRNLKLVDMFKLLGVEEHINVFKDEKNNLVNDLYKSGCKEDIINFLLEQRIKSKVEKKIQENREMVMSYLKQELIDFEDIIMFDIGYKGTISKSLEEIFEIENIKSSITHILVFATYITKDLLYKGADIRGFIGNAGENIDIIKAIERNSEPIEQLIKENIGSTMAYEKKKGKITPILEENKIRDEDIIGKTYFRESLFNFQNIFLYLDNVKKISQSLMSNKREIGYLIHRFVDMPLKKEAELIGNLYTEDNFGSNRIRKIILEQDNKLIKENGIDQFLIRCKMGYKINNLDYRDVYWPQGVVTLNNNSYFFNYYLDKNEEHIDYYTLLANKFVKYLKEKGIKDIAVYGAGELGHYMVNALKLNNIKIINLVDSKQSLWNDYVEDIRIINIQELAQNYSNNIVIASIYFENEIKNTIIQTYSKVGKSINIFSISKII